LPLSPPQKLLCVVGRKSGGKKKRGTRRRKAMGRVKKRKEAFSFLPSTTALLQYLYNSIFVEIPGRASAETKAVAMKVT